MTEFDCNESKEKLTVMTGAPAQKKIKTAVKSSIQQSSMIFSIAAIISHSALVISHVKDGFYVEDNVRTSPPCSAVPLLGEVNSSHCILEFDSVLQIPKSNIY